MDIEIQKHLDLLGKRVSDRVTGFTGVVVSIGFDLFGCVQAVVNPGLDKDNKQLESSWFDVSRLQVQNEMPVMERPNYLYGPVAAGEHGPADKPVNTRY